MQLVFDRIANLTDTLIEFSAVMTEGVVVAAATAAAVACQVITGVTSCKGLSWRYLAIVPASAPP